MKKIICALTLAAVCCSFAACGSSEISGDSYSQKEYSVQSSTSYSKQYDSYQSDDTYVAHDWMKDQAAGKDYGYDDGGSYYCMGKNDTCPNKTNNKYDLYCSSCDPDGDNIEG